MYLKYIAFYQGIHSLGWVPPSLFPHASGIDIFVTYSLLISLNSFLYNARNSYAFHVENQLWVFVLKMWFLAF